MDPERLSATDQAFLAMEDRGLPMHVGVVLVMEGGDGARSTAPIDLTVIRARLRGAITRVPRLRQKVTHVRGLGRAWIDDPRFRLEDHVVAMTAPYPGGHDELMTLAGRLFSMPLDRERPLWKLWAISGLEGGRWAMVLVGHHAMIDGVGGIGVLAAMIAGAGVAPSAIAAARAPSRPALARALLTKRAMGLVAAVRRMRQTSVGAVARETGTAFLGIARALRDGLTPAPRTPLNPKRVSSSRAFDGVRLDLARAKAIRGVLGGTVNDVILATVTGALRRYLERRAEVERLRPFRALIPVDLRARTGEAHPMGNSIAFMLAALPISEPDPLRRYAAVRASTAHLKHRSHEIEAAAWIERVADVVAPRLVELTFRVTARVRVFHVVVSNVPGPTSALSFGPAKIEEVYGLVPLFGHQALGVTVMSYAGGLYFAVHTDASVVADPRELSRDVEASFEELAALATRDASVTERDGRSAPPRPRPADGDRSLDRH